jgi:hypothetical protein
VINRTVRVLLCVGVCQALAPARAHAWWEAIEKMSGPGRFYGWSLEARLVCFATPIDPAQPADAEQAGIMARVPLPLESIFASCRLRENEIRRAAIDLNARFVWADDNEEFAVGQRISLTTFAPSISWNVIPSAKWDIVDVGLAGGVYWFSSEAFRSLNGTFFEPLRFDFHAPTRLKKEKDWAVFIPRVRVGWLVFPAGFEPDAFAPAVPQRISRDWVRNIALFIDLESLLRLNR